jgi:hypothetical protein
LEDRVDGKGVRKGFGAQRAGFASVLVVSCDPGNLQDSCRCKSSIKTCIGDVSAHVDMILRDCTARMLVRGDKYARAGKKKRIPFEIGTANGGRINASLIFPEAPEG